MGGLDEVEGWMKIWRMCVENLASGTDQSVSAVLCAPAVGGQCLTPCSVLSVPVCCSSCMCVSLRSSTYPNSCLCCSSEPTRLCHRRLLISS